MNNELLSILQGKLLISCQDYEGVMIPAAIQGGAAGLRLNGPQAVRFARARTNLPILACNKIYFPNSDVYITPSLRTAISLINAGADLVAFDSRFLTRPRQTVADMIRVIHEHGRMAVADVSAFEEGLLASQQGADIVATTFSQQFSPEMIFRLSKAGCKVLAEGQIDSPEKTAAALQAGAWAVCVGTAITRPHVLASQFSQATR
jgi:N-acylglucosamine-6-phosphate 2-epimerase